MDWVTTLAIGAGGSVVGAMAATIFTSRGLSHELTEKIAELKDLVHDVAKSSSNESVKIHEQKLHQDSMYEYVKDQLNDHKGECGVKVESELNHVKVTMTQIEKRQTGMSMKLSLVANMMTKIAEKMDIHPDINALEED